MISQGRLHAPCMVQRTSGGDSAAQLKPVGSLHLTWGVVSTVPQIATELEPSEVKCTVGGGSTAGTCGASGGAPSTPAVLAAADAVTCTLPCRCAARSLKFAGRLRSRQQALRTNKQQGGRRC